LAALVLVAVALAGASGGCGNPNNDVSGFAAPGGGGASGQYGQDGAASDATSDVSAFSFGDADITLVLDGDMPERSPPASTCKLPGLWCYQTANCTTTLSGTVYDPAGLNPLNNVIVYVPADPSKPLDKITPGTNSCSACTTQIENYMALTVTDVKGHFSMKGVPATTSVPVVVQVGKWRRQVTLSKITACQDNPLPNGALRLPRNRSEGDMPQMGLLTGGCDDLGCFMRGIGIDASEFSAPRAGGRLDIYQGSSAGIAIGGINIGGTAPALSTGTAGNCTGSGCPLWSTKQDLEYYDMVFLACECSENNTTKPASAMQAVHDWLGEGGKVFATHFHYTWFKNSPATDFQNVATWLGTSTGSGMGNYTVDTSFRGGMIFDQWLDNVGAATGTTIALNQVAQSVSSVSSAAQRWIYDTNSPPNTKYLSFLTPIGGTTASAGTPPTGSDAGVADAASADGASAEAGSSEAGSSSGASGEGPVYCGKAVFSDLHTSGMPSGDVPGACNGGPLTAQQKALEFLLFDLAACVAPENMPMPTPVPNPPPPPVPM
jgi:hypothetical protein